MRKLLLFLTISFVASICFADNSSIRYKYYRLGDCYFIAIKDQDTNMGKSILLNPDAAILKRIMPDNQNPSTINTFLLKTKDKTVLFDTGTGLGGKAIENLKAAGIDPDKIDIVIITHMHGDHVGGLVTSEGLQAFINSEIYINDIELQYWIDNISLDTGTSNLARQIKALYGDKIKTFKWGESIIPEIQALSAPGHTPGHTIFEITAGKDKMLVIGDIIHNTKVQTAVPTIAVTFDVNPNQATETRRAVFKDVQKRKIRVAGMHIHFPGIGYIEESGGGSYFFNPSMR